MNNKYRNKWTLYNGVNYQSKAEAAYAENLDRCIELYMIREWTRQIPFHLGCPENKYVVDFRVVGTDGKVWYVDVKGVETPKFKHDKKLWKVYGPGPLLIIKKRGKKFVTTEMIEPEDNRK